MKFSSFRYVGPQCFKSMRYNGWMTLATLITITIAMFLFGFFCAILVNVQANLDSVEQDVRILVYVDYSATAQDQEALRKELGWINGVQSVEFVSKEDALRDMEERYGDEDLLESLGGVNPLPDMFSLTASEPSLVDSIAEAAGKMDNVFEVRYGEETVSQLFSFTSTLKKFGFIVMGLLAVCAVVLISLAIRLTIQNRKKEIMVMKWVGATESFIRWPFLLEGMILGFGGSLLALALLLPLYDRAAVYIGMNVGFLEILPLSQVWLPATAVMLLSGLLLGIIGSMLPLARFMDV